MGRSYNDKKSFEGEEFNLKKKCTACCPYFPHFTLDHEKLLTDHQWSKNRCLGNTGLGNFQGPRLTLGL